MNNRVGTAASSLSGGGAGFRINVNGGAVTKVLFASNVIRQEPNGRGIEIISRNGTGGTDATVTNNDVDTNFVSTVQNGGFSLSNIFLQSNCLSVCNTLRSNITGNTVPGVAPTGELVAGQIALIRTGASTNQLVDNAPASPDAASELASQNTGSTATSGTITLIAGPINTPPLMLAPGGVSSQQSPSGPRGFSFNQFSTGVDLAPFDFTSSSWLVDNTTPPASIAETMTATGSGNLVSAWLSQEQLDAAVSTAIERWSATGLTQQQIRTLRGVKFEVSDLSDSYLGQADSNRILIDRKAGGRGWYTGSDSLSDLLFNRSVSTTRRYTDPISAPAGRIDLLTAIEHEMGHKLGLDDSYAEKDRDSLMYGYLTVGERRVPAVDQAKGAKHVTLQRSHFLSISSAVKPESAARGGSTSTAKASTNTAALAPLALPTVSVTVGMLPANKSVFIKFQATVNNSLTPTTTTHVFNQGTVSGGNFSNVLTDDPAAGGAADPTDTPLARKDLSITSVSDGVTTAVPGDTLSYTINYKEPGPRCDWRKLTEIVPTGMTSCRQYGSRVDLHA